MNQLEKQLQSWTPRRPSPRIARRLFGSAPAAAPAARRWDAWNWLTPLAACALTILVCVHTANRPAAEAGSRNNTAFIATLMLEAGGSSNMATYSLSEMDENLEWNVWPHAAHHVSLPARAELPSRVDVWKLSPTNR